MKITIRPMRPRNPWVAVAALRVAGLHRTSERSHRQRDARTVQRELTEMKHIP